MKDKPDNAEWFEIRIRSYAAERDVYFEEIGWSQHHDSRRWRIFVGTGTKNSFELTHNEVRDAPNSPPLADRAERKICSFLAARFGKG